MPPPAGTSYIPRHFALDDRRRQFALIADYPFGLLIAATADGPRLSHLPFIADPDRGARGHLRCHVARANPIWGDVAAGAPLIAVFSGPHAYVSPDWYASPGLVPTWNYAAIYARGQGRLMDEAETAALLADLSAASERRLHPKPAWTTDKVPAAELAALRRAVVGIDIALTAIEGKAKMSQNRGAGDRAGVAAALRALGGDGELAVAAMVAAADQPPGD